MMILHTIQFSAVRQYYSQQFTYSPFSGVLQLNLSRVGIYVDDPGDHFAVVAFTKVVCHGETFELPLGCSDVIVGDTTDVFIFVDAFHASLSGVYTAWSDQTAAITKRTVQTPGLAGDIGPVTIVAMYEPATGKISYKHVASAFQGGRIVSEEEALKTAQDLATRASLDVTQLKLKVSNYTEHIRPEYQIDPSTGEFVFAAIPGFTSRGLKAGG